MGRVQKQMQMMKKKGYNNIDLLRMREVARIEAQKMEDQANERAFLYMLAIPLSILFNDYWQKTAKKRAPKFIEEVIKYYEAVQDGYVTDKELADLLFELSGVKFDKEWMKGR